jgi:hypothetical protein
MRFIRGIVRISGPAALIAAGGLAFPSWASETITYTYDARGRLVVAKSTGAVNNNRTRSYCYDKAGNRIEYDSNQTGVPDACVTTG